MAAAGYFSDVFIGATSVFFLLILAQRFFGDSSYAIIGPLGLAIIIGSSNYVSPKASLEAIFPALLYLSFWYAFAGAAFWLIGIETKGRSIEEISNSLDERAATAEVRTA